MYSFAEKRRKALAAPSLSFALSRDFGVDAVHGLRFLGPRPAEYDLAADGDPGREPRGEALAVLVRLEGHADAGPVSLAVALLDAPGDVVDRAGFGGFFVFRCHGLSPCLHYPFGRCLRLIRSGRGIKKTKWWGPFFRKLRTSGGNDFFLEAMSGRG